MKESNLVRVVWHTVGRKQPGRDAHAALSSDNFVSHGQDFLELTNAQNYWPMADNSIYHR